MDLAPSEEQAAPRDLAADFVDREVVPYAAERGTSQIQKLLIGRALTGVNAFA
jgi:hypothetical protein